MIGIIGVGFSAGGLALSMDVLTWAAAQAIATIALNKFVESGAGELGKQLTAALSEKVMTLGTVV